MSEISRLIVEMDEQGVLAAVRTASEAEVTPSEVIAELQEGMREIGDKYEAGEYFLSELIMSAEIFKRALAELGIDEADDLGDQKDVFVLGTAHSDVHDIGKNIVASVLGANGFKVIDLGVDVPPERFVAAVKEYDARLVGISSLLTTAYPAIRETVAAFEGAGLRDEVRIFVGGGPMTPEVARQLGADGAGASAQEAVVLATASITGGVS